MWIKFWYAYNSKDGEKSISYDWVSNRETAQSLKEMSSEIVPSYVQLGDCPYYTGFEYVEKLPPDIVEEKIKELEKQINHCNCMMKILRDGK